MSWLVFINAHVRMPSAVYAIIMVMLIDVISHLRYYNGYAFQCNIM